MEASKTQRPRSINPSVMEPAPRDHQPRVDPFTPSYGYGPATSTTGLSLNHRNAVPQHSDNASLASSSTQYVSSRSRSQQREDRAARYNLTIRQQPIAARACGMGERDRRVIDPPPIIQLTLKNFDPRSVADVDALRNPHNAIHCTLLDQSGSDITQSQDTHNPGRTSRRLTGSIMASPFVGIDPSAPASNLKNARMGSFFIFPDISCRQIGHYRLRFTLVQQTVESLFTGGQSSILGVIESDIFEVFTAQSFPGMRASTDLMMDLKRQGASVSVRRGNDARSQPKGHR
ncbi:MAG: hypothetical protein Q9219_003266 [cf. Caloplaca sp. 3 TL-2023]